MSGLKVGDILRIPLGPLITARYLVVEVTSAGGRVEYVPNSIESQEDSTPKENADE